MKARVIKTGEIVIVYHEPQHGQITNIYKEAVLLNGRMWTEDELDFSINSKLKEVDIEKTLSGFQNFYAHENSGEFPSAIEIAKHFFELGLKAKGE